MHTEALLRLALDALIYHTEMTRPIQKTADAMVELRAALAAPAAQSEPVAWALTKQLEKRETTNRGYLWFTNPQNSAWTALYASAAPAAPSVPPDERITRLTAAIEGECDGLAISAKTAAAILRYVETGTAPTGGGPG